MPDGAVQRVQRRERRYRNPDRQLWRQGMLGAANAHYACSSPFPNRLHEDLKTIDVPCSSRTDGRPDRAVCGFGASVAAAESGCFEDYDGLPHGMRRPHPDILTPPARLRSRRAPTRPGNPRRLPMNLALCLEGRRFHRRPYSSEDDAHEQVIVLVQALGYADSGRFRQPFGRRFTVLPPRVRSSKPFGADSTERHRPARGFRSGGSRTISASSGLP